MINSLKNKKKKGFTLVEIIAVIAIIAILAAVLVPKVMGYMKEAKKTKVIDQARKVVTAAESISVKKGSATHADSWNAPQVQNATGSLISDDDYSLLGNTINVASLKNLLDAETYTFSISDDGKLITNSIINY